MSLRDRSFGFPGTPYKIQESFMSALYEGLTKGGVIVLESPTGTGKSLSLTCGTLTWFIENRESLLAEKLGIGDDIPDSSSEDENVPPWLRKGSQECSLRHAQELIQQWNRQQVALREKVSKLRLCTGDRGTSDTFYAHKKRKTDIRPDKIELESDVIHSEGVIHDDNLERNPRPRVFFCSRTHSQLSQLIREIRKTSFTHSLGMVTLSSRRQTCINHSVIDLNAPGADTVDEGCRKLVESDKCSFYTGAGDLSLILSAKLKDIEDQYSEGLRVGACPYYASRYSAKTADVILVPYISILSAEMRRSLDIDVKDNIIVIDEAHNLMDALGSALTVRIDHRSLETLSVHITDYCRSYAAVIAPRNLVWIRKLGFLIRQLLNWICSINSDSLYDVPSVVKSGNLDESDIGGVTLFLESSDFKRKLRGFAGRLCDGSSPGSVYTLHTFLQRIQNSSQWDRISVRVVAESREILYVPIDCESTIAQLVKQARAVVLVGGTMKPVDEYKAIADSAGVPFTSFVATYRVESERLFAGMISSTAEGSELLFTHQHRYSEGNLNSLREIVTSVFAAEPRGGVIMFVSSYEYAQEVKRAMCLDGFPQGLTIICDSKGSKSADILDHYRQCVFQAHSVLLISVIGGSLSEGIDFRDDLCRCVMVVGLPYPNRFDPVINERIKFFDLRNQVNESYPDGDQYYRICCMRAVNQCIGRAIRHHRDWASVLLIDARYSRPDIQESLSDWVRSSLVSQNIKTITSTLRPFFTTASRISS